MDEVQTQADASSVTNQEQQPVSKPKKSRTKKVAKKSPARKRAAVVVKRKRVARVVAAVKPKRKYTRRGSNVVSKLDNSAVLTLLVSLRKQAAKLTPKEDREYKRAVKALTT